MQYHLTNRPVANESQAGGFFGPLKPRVWLTRRFCLNYPGGSLGGWVSTHLEKYVKNVKFGHHLSQVQGEKKTKYMKPPPRFGDFFEAIL